MTFLFLAAPLLLRCQRPLPAALVVYFDLFLAQVHLEDLLVLHDPLAQPDLLLEHDALGDHDLLLEDLQDHLVLADVLLGGTAGLPGLPHCRHPLDVYYLLAPLRDSHHLALGVYALPDVHPTGLALADAGADFLLRALHPQVFLEVIALVSVRSCGAAVRRSFIAALVNQYGPFWAGSLCSERPKQRGCTLQNGASPEGLCLEAGAASALGVVLYFHFLAPDVLLDDLGVLHNVLADSHLFLGHSTLLRDYLFLSHRHGHFVLAYLGLCGLAAYRHPLDRDFLVLYRHLYLLAVGPDALADLYGSGLALAGSCP